ncbi:MAG: c-type cytochrome [Candidatus Omnitrophica bacterium]|nr:c-type cytochrome [Candidatus Omnitrophota bacterium]
MRFAPASTTYGRALSVLLVFGVGIARAASAQPPTPDLQAGRAAYLKSCARCHGISGHGDGLDAKRFYPRPRDFSLGVYKFRSTASGTPPTDEDLMRTITSGLPGTNMPDWQSLDEATRWQLVYYLKSLSPTFAQTQPAPVKLAPDPGPARADLKTGRAIYEQLGCAACHGHTGRANGTSAAGVVDDWGMPIRPANLTQGWAYRGGNDPRSVMLRVLSGLDGAGMPSYAEALSPEDAWQLAYYVASLQENPHWNMIAHPLIVEGELPGTADDPRWASAERTDVRLRNVVNAAGEWTAPPTVRMMTFEAIVNGEGISFRLSWDDPTKDVKASPDRVAVLLKPAETRGDVVTLQAWPYAGSPSLDLCAWSADTGNIFEALASNFDAIQRLGNSQAPLEGVSGYDDGRWRIVFRRPLEPASPSGAATITPEAFTPVAFAVWDGGNPAARAVSPWLELALGRRREDASHH